VSKLGLLVTFAGELGLDTAASDQTVADTAKTTRIEEDFAGGKAMEVWDTSTFFVDGEKRELNSLTVITDLLGCAVAN